MLNGQINKASIIIEQKQQNSIDRPMRSGDGCPAQPLVHVDTETATQLQHGGHGNNEASGRTELTQRLAEVRRQWGCRPRPSRVLASTSRSPGCLVASVSSSHRVANGRQLGTQHATGRLAHERQTGLLLTTSTTTNIALILTLSINKAIN